MVGWVFLVGYWVLAMSAYLSNAHLNVCIAEMGAEIKSIRERSTGIEYIWKGDPTWWSGSAPILFPIIGGLRNGTYLFKGKTYSMPSHGIVRKKEWALVSSDTARATFRTQSSDETKAMYPFDFVLKAHYGLVENSLLVTYEVVNSGKDTMYFSIGSHPAFSMPFAGGHLEHYYYHFSRSENIERHFFGDGMCLNETAPVFDNSRQIFITRELFSRGAVILKHPASKVFELRNSHSGKLVRVVTQGVPYLGLWGPSGGPFACIEPWLGVPDPEDTNGELTTKEGIMPLNGGSTFTTEFRIEIV
jgi:galactose mutarotase-like enzyme